MSELADDAWNEGNADNMRDFNLPAEAVIEVAPGEYERCAVPAQVAPLEPVCRCLYCRTLASQPAVPAQEASGRLEPIPCPECKSPIFVRENNTIVAHYNRHGDRCKRNETLICDCHHHKNQVCDACQGVTGNETDAEPQAGAQVPPRDEIPEISIQIVRALSRQQLEEIALGAAIRIARTEAELTHIRNYATEAAKTPITRESISAEKIETPRPTPPDPCSVGKRTVTVAYPVMQTTKYIDAAESYISQLEAALNAQTLTGLSQFDEMQGLRRRILSESGGGK